MLYNSLPFCVYLWISLEFTAVDFRYTARGRHRGRRCVRWYQCGPGVIAIE